MGKRELLIALAFIVVGVVAYQVTAPPPKEGEGFSLRQLWNKMRAEIQEDASRATVTTTNAIRVPPTVSELRLIEVPRGLKVIGEARDDIAYELRVESTGPTEDAARKLASAATLVPDEFGSSLGLRMTYPVEGRRSAQLVMRVPATLAIRLQSVRAVEVSHVAAVTFEGVAGDTKVMDIKGSLTGAHSSGELMVQRVGAVKLTLLNSDARIERVTGGVIADGRGSELHITDSAGPIELNALNQEIVIAGHTGPVRVTGSGGRIDLTHPTEESRIDMRRTEVTVTMVAAVPLMLSTTDEPLTLRLGEAAAINVDAIATEGKIDATAFALTPVAGDREQRLAHPFAPAATARVSIRNLRGDIVIGKTK